VRHASIGAMFNVAHEYGVALLFIAALLTFCVSKRAERLVHWHRPVLSQIKSAAALLWFRKQLRAPNSESNWMITQTAPGNAKHIILVVDDDQAVRDSVRNMMESEGFEVRAFSNGHDLLNEASLPAAGCMVVDYNMPSLNGLELVGTLRGRGVSMPAILITGNPTKHVRDRAAAIAVLVVEKPQLGNYLVDCVREAVVRRP
jgi:two-component system, LuxR family, response regulator FixJ